MILNCNAKNTNRHQIKQRSLPFDGRLQNFGCVLNCEIFQGIVFFFRWLIVNRKTSRSENPDNIHT